MLAPRWLREDWWETFPSQYETSLSEDVYVMVFEVRDTCSGTLLAFKHYSTL